MSEETGEKPATQEAGETPAKPEDAVKPKPEETKETEKGEKPTDSEAEGLRKALKAERELREAAEKAAKKATRTTEERVADLEKQNQDLRMERMANATVDKLIKGLGDGFTVSRDEVMEELEDAKLTEANMEAVIGRWVNKLKKPATVKTPDNAARPASDAGKPEPSVKDPWAGANF